MPKWVKPPETPLNKGPSLFFDRLPAVPKLCQMRRYGTLNRAMAHWHGTVGVSSRSQRHLPAFGARRSRRLNIETILTWLTW